MKGTNWDWDIQRFSKKLVKKRISFFTNHNKKDHLHVIFLSK